jgi:uncharacterized protein with von Willebrand factor type A (vWA) domain
MNDTLPLYKVFNALRKNKFDLGIAEYYALLDALHAGFRLDESKGHFDKDNLQFICEMLWLKPNQSRNEFVNIFEENFQNILPDNTSPSQVENKNQSANENKSENQSNNQKTQNSDNQIDINNNATNKNTEEPITNNPIDQTAAEFRIKFDLTTKENNPAQHNMREDAIAPKRNFLFSENYFGINQRQMQQVCRFLPIFQGSLFSPHLNIKATVLHWAKKGYFEKPIFKPQESLYNCVVLLIDNKGSMIAFDGLADMLCLALKDAFKNLQYENEPAFKQYYFYNVPQSYVYTDKAHIKSKNTAQLFQEIQKRKALVLILSDGGAARGGNSDARFKSSLRFLLRLRKVAHQLVWLNPLPQSRWENTTAQRIARFLPMCSLENQNELQKAINFLKGKVRWKQEI